MASSTTAEVEPSVPCAVAQEVAKIQDSAARLGELLEAELAGNSTVGAVLGELLQSSSRAFSMVNWTIPGGDVGSPSPREASSKRRRTGPAGGGRKRSNSCAKKIVKSKSLDDGQTWRKYGQKQIQNSDHPRSYFRCTHRYDQGCMARRQVQRAEDDPKTFVITYEGEHTCRAAMASDHMASASGFRENACLIRFGATSSASFGAPPKQESTEEDVVSNLTTASASSSPEFYGLPAVVPTYENPTLGATAAGDVTSGIHDDLELELLIDSCFGGISGFDDGRFY